MVILGSTGSIGTQALDVARERGYTVTALAAGRNLALLQQQVREFRPALVSVEPAVYAEATALLPGTRVTADVSEVAALRADVVVNAMSGLIGLSPTRRALEAGRAVALATKEAMVTAGMVSPMVASAEPRNAQANPDSPCRSLQGLKWSEDIAAVKPACSACWTSWSSWAGSICSCEQ